MIQVQMKYVGMADIFEKIQAWFVKYLASEIFQEEQNFPSFVVIALGCAMKTQPLLWFYCFLSCCFFLNKDGMVFVSSPAVGSMPALEKWAASK